MWTNEPLTIEKREDGLWHVAFIQPDGALLARTTVLPKEAGGVLEPAGWSGESTLAAEVLRECSGSLPDSAAADRQRAAAEATLEWITQFPAGEDRGRDGTQRVGIEPNGRIVARKQTAATGSRLTTSGRVRNFRTGLRPRGGLPTVFEAWRATTRPGEFVAVQLLQRPACEAGWDSWQRIRHEDQWYETLLQWWTAAEERGAVHLHPGGIWALGHEFAGPANPITIP